MVVLQDSGTKNDLARFWQNEWLYYKLIPEILQDNNSKSNGTGLQVIDNG